MDQMAPAHFIAGWLDTLEGVDFHDKITQCFTPSEDLTQDVYYFMELSAQAPQAAAQFWLKAIEAYKIALKNCDESILDANTKWTKRMHEITTDPDFNEKSWNIYSKHEDEYNRDFQAIFDDWEAKKYYQSGVDKGLTEKLLIDNWPKTDVTALFEILN